MDGWLPSSALAFTHGAWREQQISMACSSPLQGEKEMGRKGELNHQCCLNVWEPALNSPAQVAYGFFGFPQPGAGLAPEQGGSGSPQHTA